jgi:hypothetical protein
MLRSAKIAPVILPSSPRFTFITLSDLSASAFRISMHSSLDRHVASYRE